MIQQTFERKVTPLTIAMVLLLLKLTKFLTTDTKKFLLWEHWVLFTIQRRKPLDEPYFQRPAMWSVDELGWQMKLD